MGNRCGMGATSYLATKQRPRSGGGSGGDVYDLGCLRSVSALFIGVSCTCFLMDVLRTPSKSRQRPNAPTKKVYKNIEARPEKGFGCRLASHVLLKVLPEH